ncbi:MAG: tetratricopeptide repeat protein, partial [Rhodothermales bacterium]|nr:tetratricopeptide repeat protein [Rhodothermales bacterium]
MKANRLFLLLAFCAPLFTRGAEAQTEASIDSLYILSGTPYNEGDYVEAIRLLRLAAEQQEFISGTNSLRYANIIDDLGYVLTDVEEYAEAEQQLVHALEIRQELSSPDSLDLGDSHENFARLYARTGDHEKAQRSYNEAEVYYARYYGNQSSSYAYFVYLWASELYNASQFLAAAEPYGIAARSYREAEGPESMNVVYCLRNEAYSYSQAGEYARSVDLFEALIGEYSTLEAAANEVPGWYKDRGEAMLKSEDAVSAAASFDQSLVSLLELTTEESDRYIQFVSSIAGTYENAAFYEEAVDWYSTALSLTEVTHGRVSQAYCRRLNAVAVVRIKQERYPESLSIFGELLPIVKEVFEPTDASYRTINENFVYAADRYSLELFNAGNLDSLVAFHYAVLGVEENLNGKDGFYSKLLYQLGDALTVSGDTTDGVAIFEEVIEFKKGRDEIDADLGEAYKRVGDVLFSRKQFEQVASMYQNAAEIFQVDLGRKSSNYIHVVHRLSYVLVQTGQLDSAYRFGEEAVALSLEVYGESNPLHAQYVQVLGGIQRQRGNLEDAVSLIQRAIALEDAHRMDQSKNAILWEQQLANHFFKTHDYSNARDGLLRTIDRIERTDLAAHIYWDAASLLINALIKVHDNEQALRVAFQARAYCEQYPVEDSDAWILLRLADALNANKRHEEAAQVSMEAIDVFKNRYGPEHAFVGSAMASYGVDLMKAGKLEASDQAQMQAEDILSRAAIPGNDIGKYISTLTMLANASILTGQYQRALRLFERVSAIPDLSIQSQRAALAGIANVHIRMGSGSNEFIGTVLEISDLIRQEYSATHPDYINHHLFVAMSYASMHESDRAQVYLDEVQQILESNALQNTILYAAYLSTRASNEMLVNKSNGRSQESTLALIREAIGLYEFLGEELDDGYSTALLFANSVAALGREWDAAFQFLYKNADIIERKYGVISREYIDAMTWIWKSRGILVTEELLEEAEAVVLRARSVYGDAGLGRGLSNVLDAYGSLLLWSGDYEGALAALEESTAFLSAAAGDDSPRRIPSLLQLSKTLRMSGFLERSAVAANEAFRLGDLYFANSFGHLSMDAMFNTMALYNDLSVVVDLALRDPRYRAPAAEWVLQRKGTISRTTAEYRKVQLQSAVDPEIRQLLGNLKDAKQRLVTIELADHSDSDLSRIISEQRLYIGGLEQELREKSGIVESIHATLDDVQSELASRVVAEILKVSLYSPSLNAEGKYLTPPHYVAFVIRSDTVDLVDLGEASRIDNLVREYADAIDSARRDLVRGGDEADLEEEVVAIGNDIYNMVISPLAEYLPESGRLVISPDGELNRVPFSALTDDNDRYLIERYDISYVTSAADLVRQEQEVGEGTVVFAGPDFDLGAQDRLEAAGASANESGTEVQVGGPDKIITRGMKWDPLAGAAAEAEDVQESLSDTEYGPVSTYS